MNEGSGCGNRSRERTEKRKKGKKLPAAYERLQEHDQHAKGRPDQLGQHAMEIDGLREHLAVSQPFYGHGVRGVGRNVVGMDLRFGVRRGFISPLRLHLVDYGLRGRCGAPRNER